MAGKPGHGGRPKSAVPRRAYQVKLPLHLADAFDVLVERREADGAKVGATASAAGVLLFLIRRALIEEGLLVERSETPSPGEAQAHPKTAAARKAPKKVARR